MAVYLATIALEKNRYAEGKIPSFLVSDYANRIIEDGFAGVELWENHYMKADAGERERLCRHGIVQVFNTYISFENGLDEVLREEAEAINRVHPNAIKFNLGSAENRQAQVETLKQFADLLFPDIRLLCECHANTLMEEPEVAGEVFAKLDQRFGAIVHLASPLEELQKCFDCYGDRICHVHIQKWNRDLERYVNLEEAEDLLRQNHAFLMEKGFNGTYTLEFVKGLQIEEMYPNALVDLRWLKSIGIY